MNTIFIPIKEKSQRVPEKNFRIFKNIKLYKNTILKFNKDFNIFIDTDSQEIFQWANNQENVKCFYRKKYLLGHTTSVNKLIKNFIQTYNLKNENLPISQIHITNPFLKKTTIEKSFNLLKNNNWDSIVSCDVIQSRLWQKDKSKYVAVNHNPNVLLQTQDLPKIYNENSCFYTFYPKTFLENNNRIGINPYFQEVEFPENVDIDTESDWDLVKKIEKIL